MTFRFLHLADVHLDTPFQSRDSKHRSYLREAIRQAFQTGVDLALAEKVHAVLIAGDLFDNNTLSFTTEKFLLNQVRRLQEAKISVFYSPGNHDPYGSSYRLSQLHWPDNVNIFCSRVPRTIPVTDQEGRTVALISGVGHEDAKESGNLVQAFPPAQGTTPYIGLLHALVCDAQGAGNHDKYAPCLLADLKEKGYAYWALGHVHARIELSEKPFVVYPGNLVGRNPRENGPKGGYLVEINGTGQVKTTFHILSPLSWATLKIDDISAACDFESLARCLYEALQKQLESENLPGRLFLRVILQGQSPLYRDLLNTENLAALTEDLQNLLDLQYLELSTAALMPPVNPDRYRNEPHVLGTALALIEALKNDDELLLRLAPEQLAGWEYTEDKLGYLRSLLEGMDSEAVVRLLDVVHR